jgi:hypothetical protein
MRRRLNSRRELNEPEPEPVLVVEPELAIAADPLSIGGVLSRLRRNRSGLSLN